MKNSYRAVFARGGTSKALIFHEDDLPVDREERSRIFLRAMGSPDPHGRQLDGMGGGLSSLSKVCIVGRPTHPDADVDYTFAQVQVKTARVDYSGNCGNMSSAIGPYAVDEGLVPCPDDGDATVRIHNVNTSKIIESTFPVAGGRSVHTGDLAIPGVAGTGAPIRLDFLAPGGASTGHMLVDGQVRTVVETSSERKAEVTLLDVANACAFVGTDTVGLQGTELPEEVDRRTDVMEELAAIRAGASVAFGIAPTAAEARRNLLLPFVTVVSPPADFRTLGGERIAASDFDVAVRVISNGQCHRAVPMTIALCTAVAVRLPGSIPAAMSRPVQGPVRIGTPSGVITVDSTLQQTDAGIEVRSGAVYRTSRRLFAGEVFI